MIAFITGLPQKDEQAWLTLLTECLPDEKILPPAQIRPEQQELVDIAIVANPDPAILKQFPNLVWIQSLWAGVEKLVTQLPNLAVKLVRLVDPVLAETMAEAVLAWTLYIHRDMPRYALQQTNKHWLQHRVKLAKEVHIGMLGSGSLGIAAIEKLALLGYQVHSWSRSEKDIAGVQTYTGKSGLSLMLSKTDILVNLLPLTSETKAMLNLELLSQLPKGASLINFSRGGVVDTNDLLKLLENSHLCHAVLDVFDQEPLPNTSPLWHHQSITILPHISAPTNMNSAANIVRQNVQNYRLKQIVPTCVDINRGY